MDFNSLMKQAQQMQAQMEKDQAELESTVFTGIAGSEIEVDVNGAYEVVDVRIAKELLSEDNQEMLQDMIMIAVNDALAQIGDERSDKMGAMAQGLNIPGLQ